ncbi:unnamed protein product [Phytophthora fragariaefolia]|uniref:Unnamed protein product n=1 Tax=Phytophthora fragariaefolia TaxID=1490495 RepID=A0A9W6X8C6_9STRA|nr:unnamed protein product [Phytophthora fragariaefolia]
MGLLFETTSVTPLACTVREAGDILWRYATNNDRASREKALNCVSLPQIIFIEDCDTYRERQHNTSHYVNDSTNNTPVRIETVSMYREYREVDRHLQLESIRWYLPSEGLDFEDKCWTVATPSPIDPGRFSVVQTHYQLQMTREGMLPAKRRDPLMQYIGNMTRSYLQYMQNAFLDCVDPFRLSSPS